VEPAGVVAAASPSASSELKAGDVSSVELPQVGSASSPAEGEVVFDCRSPTDPLRLNVESVLYDLHKIDDWTEVRKQHMEHLLALQFAVATGACAVHPTALPKLCELLELIKAKRALAAPQHYPAHIWGEHLLDPPSEAEEAVAQA
jgi:hypothetical protein